MTPKWEDAPEWAGWLAMDGDGWWWWHKDEPEWKPEYEMWVQPNDSGYAEFACDGPDESGEVDWDHANSTLEHRP